MVQLASADPENLKGGALSVKINQVFPRGGRHQFPWPLPWIGFWLVQCYSIDQFIVNKLLSVRMGFYPKSFVLPSFVFHNTKESEEFGIKSHVH